ncbi:hypothetical protein [Gemmatimonas sp.]|uniref:hypothetical protein n=1 Tax=Gemmatimonas sp. TaxID=1962908 RepID=UPI0039830FAB
MRGLDGIDVRDRRHHLRRYPHGMVAADVVTPMYSFASWYPRTQAAATGVARGVATVLMRRGDVVHVFDERPVEPTGELCRLR